jgi:hypothetical protein
VLLRWFGLIAKTTSQSTLPSVCFPEQAAPEHDSRLLIRREQEGAAPRRRPPGINKFEEDASVQAADSFLDAEADGFATPLPRKFANSRFTSSA